MNFRFTLEFLPHRDHRHRKTTRTPSYKITTVDFCVHTIYKSEVICICTVMDGCDWCDKVTQILDNEISAPCDAT
jgi:hypothetical protein